MGLFTRIIGNSWRITKAVQLCREEFSLNVDPSTHFGTFTKEAGAYNSLLDKFISEYDPNDKELAMAMLVPIIDQIAAHPGMCSLVRDVINQWITRIQVRRELAAETLRLLCEPQSA